jgi:hypothetical protein
MQELLDVADVDESTRLEALHQLRILYTPPEERYDFIVRLAARVFDVPMVGFNLIDDDRQWSKASVGLGQHSLEGSPRQDAFCNITIQQHGPLIVNDASTDRRFADYPGVRGDPRIRFYAGQPLLAPGGEAVGALCIIDDHPRSISQDDLDLLRDLANWVEKEMASSQELLDAAGMQQRLFPSTAPDLPGYRVAGRCLPARHVGGDFYDWYAVGDQYQFVLGDVMGKGIPAAMISTSVRAMLRGASPYNSVGNTVTRVAKDLEPDMTAMASFATLFCARLDPATGTVDYVDAGHGLNRVYGPHGGSRSLTSDELPVGAVTDDTWTTKTTVLAPGETLITFSDGWLDMFDDGDEAALAGQVMHLASSSPQDHVDRALQFARSHDVSDDLTIVIVTRDPVSPQPDERVTT